LSPILLARKKAGSLIFPSDFRGTGTDAAIKQALSRLEKKGLVKRLAHGIYYVPKIDPVLGELRPGADDVVKMIAQKEKIRIKPAGAYALHKLGLTTQVPTKLVYITDGHPRQFILGKLQIKFKPTTSKRLLRKGKISSLVIQALEEIGTENINEEMGSKLRQLLLQENPRILKHDLELAPVKVNNYILRILKENTK
jgi:hypothetical protein